MKCVESVWRVGEGVGEGVGGLWEGDKLETNKQTDRPTL